jgi:hypothetical protein
MCVTTGHRARASKVPGASGAGVSFQGPHVALVESDVLDTGTRLRVSMGVTLAVEAPRVMSDSGATIEEFRLPVGLSLASCAPGTPFAHLQWQSS